MASQYYYCIRLGDLFALAKSNKYFKSFAQRMIPTISSAFANDQREHHPETKAVHVEMEFPVEADSELRVPQAHADYTPNSPYYFSDQYNPLPLRAYSLSRCLQFLIYTSRGQEKADMPSDGDISDVPLHDKLDVATYLGSHVLLQEFILDIRSIMTIRNAPDVVMAVARLAFSDQFYKGEKQLEDVQAVVAQLRNLPPISFHHEIFPHAVTLVPHRITFPEDFDFLQLRLTGYVKTTLDYHRSEIEGRTSTTENLFICTICDLPGSNSPPDQRRHTLPCCQRQVHLGCWSRYHMEPSYCGFEVPCSRCGVVPTLHPDGVIYAEESDADSRTGVAGDGSGDEDDMDENGLLDVE